MECYNLNNDHGEGYRIFAAGDRIGKGGDRQEAWRPLWLYHREGREVVGRGSNQVTSSNDPPRMRK